MTKTKETGADAPVIDMVLDEVKENFQSYGVHEILFQCCILAACYACSLAHMLILLIFLPHLAEAVNNEMIEFNFFSFFLVFPALLLSFFLCDPWRQFS